MYVWLYMIIKLEIIFFTYFVSNFVFFGKSFYHWLECWKVSLMMNIFVVLYFDTNYVLCRMCLSSCCGSLTSYHVTNLICRMLPLATHCHTHYQLQSFHLVLLYKFSLWASCGYAGLWLDPEEILWCLLDSIWSVMALYDLILTWPHSQAPIFQMVLGMRLDLTLLLLVCKYV